MTIRDAIKNYRVTNHLSQKELAEIIGVTGITISRIESGKQAELSSSILVKLAKIFSLSDLKDMDNTDSEVVRLRQEIANRTGASTVPVKGSEQRAKMRAALANILDPIMEELGFIPDYAYGMPVEVLKKSEDGSVSVLERKDEIFDFVYQNNVLKKTWIFSLALQIDADSNFKESYIFLRERVFRGIGAAMLYGGANRLTLITDIADLEGYGYAELFRAPALDNAHCDVSILHVNDVLIPDSEYGVVTFGNGRGVFDTEDSSDSRRLQAYDLRAQWEKTIRLKK